MTELVAPTNSSNHVAQQSDKHLSVKLSDKALCDSNATWSPTSPFDLNFSYVEINSPKSPYSQDEQTLKAELESAELNFSYLNINSPKSQYSHEKHNSKPGPKPGNFDSNSFDPHAEFRIDIPNVVPQTETECDRFFEEWVSPFSNGEETSSSENLAGSICVSHIKNYDPITTCVFGDQKPGMHSNLSPIGSNNVSDLLELFRSSDTLGMCGLCNVEMAQGKDIFIYMDKPFCSEECRDIFIEGESGYETMLDEEDIPVANIYKHVGPVFLPINE